MVALPLRSLLGLLLVLSTLSAAAPPAAAGGGYRLPVGGEVVVGFTAPLTPYGAGHRGIDLVASLGTPVRAASHGTVVFAGRVAGERWVTLAHPDGVRTSYGPLGLVDVAAGARVAGGQRLGAVGGFSPRHPVDRLHFSARVGERYIDPLELLGDWRPALVGPGRWRAHDAAHVIRSYDDWRGGRWLGAVAAGSPDATRPGFAFAPTPNRVIGLAGIMSRTGEPPLDLTHLGYASEDVDQFGYAGLDEDDRPLAYDADDTLHGVAGAAVELREQLLAHQRAHPGRAVDLVGHSLGGVVAMAYLLFLHDPADPDLPAIGNVATIAAPLEGTDLATLALAVADHDVAGPLARNLDTALEGYGSPTVRAWARRFDLDGPSIAELSTYAPLARAMPARFRAATRDPYTGPLATGTRVLTLGAQLDPVVPAADSDLPGADHLVLPGSHGGVTRTEAVRQVLHDFLAGEPLPSSPGWGVMGASRVYGDALERASIKLRAEQIWRQLRSWARLTRTPGPVPAG